MKQKTLILLASVPIIAGYIINWTVMIPVVGTITYLLIPYLVLAFWFYFGAQFSKTDWNFISSILIGHTPGILSLGLYLWQYLIESDATRSIPITIFSQMYSNSAPLYLYTRLAMRFESQPNYIGPVTIVGTKVIALIVMIFVFAAGYIFGKMRRKAHA